jgi:hypothetical protein
MLASRQMADEGDRDAGVEQVAHAVDEDQPRRPPGVRQLQRLRVDGDPEAGTRGARVVIVLVHVSTAREY